jgi:hypothetical protein
MGTRKELQRAGFWVLPMPAAPAIVSKRCNWLSDLRGFTSLSEILPRDELIELLNQYFGPMCNAVEANGGEVLKFISDAMLAIFPVEDDAVAASRNALGAVREAKAAVNKENERRRLRRQAENPLWPGAARRRCHVRQHRRRRAARFHGDPCEALLRAGAPDCLSGERPDSPAESRPSRRGGGKQRIFGFVRRW